MFKSRVMLPANGLYLMQENEQEMCQCVPLDHSRQCILVDPSPLESLKLFSGRTSLTVRRNEAYSCENFASPTSAFITVDKPLSPLKQIQTDVIMQNSETLTAPIFHNGMCKKRHSIADLPHPSELRKKRKREKKQPVPARPPGSVEEHMQQIKERNAGIQGYGIASEPSPGMQFPFYAQASRTNSTSGSTGHCSKLGSVQSRNDPFMNTFTSIHGASSSKENFANIIPQASTSSGFQEE